MNNQTFEIKNDLWASNLNENLLNDEKTLTEKLSTSIETRQELSEIINHDFTQKNKISDESSLLIEEAFELDEAYSDTYEDEIDYTNPKNNKKFHKEVKETNLKNKTHKNKTKINFKNSTQKELETFGLAA